MEVVFLGFPGEIKRVNGNAVSAQPWPGIKGLEAKRLGGGCRNHFPDVDAHAQAEQLEFIDQRDIYAAVDVLQQFGHLRRRRRRYRDRPMKDGAIELACQLRGPYIQSANY